MASDSGITLRRARCRLLHQQPPLLGALGFLLASFYLVPQAAICAPSPRGHVSQLRVFPDPWAGLRPGHSAILCGPSGRRGGCFSSTLPHGQMLFLQCSVPLGPKESPHLDEQAGSPRGSGTRLCHLTSCVISGRLPNLSGPRFPHLLNRVSHPCFQGSCKGHRC